MVPASRRAKPARTPLRGPPVAGRGRPVRILVVVAAARPRRRPADRQHPEHPEEPADVRAGHAPPGRPARPRARKRPPVTTVTGTEIAPALASLREITEGALVVLIGPPGSGKSTLAGRVWQPDQVLSLDKLRLAVSGDECDQSATPDAVSLLRTMTSMRL